MSDDRARYLIVGGKNAPIRGMADGQYLKYEDGEITGGDPGGSGEHSHEQSEVVGLVDALAAKAANDHNHDASYDAAGSAAQALLEAYAADFSGSYNDLTDKPTLFSGSYDDLTDKPSLFGGSYNNLTDKPTLGDAASLDVGTAAGTVAAGDHTHAGGGAAIDAWPVGSVFIAVVNTSPATLLGGGTWAAFGAGRMIVGRDANDTDFDTAEETGGAKTVTLTAAQSGLPQHTHVQNAHTHDFLPRSGTSGAVSSIVTGTLDTSSAIGGANQPHVQLATAVNQNAGPSAAAEAHTNMPPYIVVYMWKRTA